MQRLRATVLVLGFMASSAIMASSPAVAATAPGLKVDMSVSPDVAAVGQTVTYSYQVTNTGEVDMSGVAVLPGAFSGSGTPTAPSCPATSLAAGTAMECTASYTVTAADQAAGKVTATVTAQGTPAGLPLYTSAPSRVTLLVSQPRPSLALKISASPGTVQAASAVGTTVTYQYLVINDGDAELAGVGVDEVAFSGSGQLSAISCPATSLALHGSMICTATYAVTQADVAAGTLTNIAIATGTPPSGPPAASPDAKNEVVIAVAGPSLTMATSVAPSQVPAVRAAGSLVTYSFDITNNGSVTLTGIAVHEVSFSGSGTLSPVSCQASALGTGGRMTCTATYTLTAADAAAEMVTSIASASGSPPAGPQVTSDQAVATVVIIWPTGSGSHRYLA